MTQATLYAPPVEAGPAKPFLKWAGGKTQLIPDIKKLLPSSLEGRRYFEPFMGSAALYFHLSPVLGRSCLGDLNGELVLTFLAVRDHLEALLDSLKSYDQTHNGGNTLEQQTSNYYAVRALDRSPGWADVPLNDADKVVAHGARFIYLNRTCFNGLWRVNSRGHYNVPMGRYKNPGILNEKLLRQASAALQGMEIRHQSFERTAMDAQAGDLVYFDPPYMPLSATSSFNAYAKDTFLEPAHQRLAVVALVLATRGAQVLLSNSDTPFTRLPLPHDREGFTTTVTPIVESLGKGYAAAVGQLHEFYTYNWRVETVYASRAINSKASQRGSVSEIIVHFGAV